jgi:aspartyl-tRNA(Asn)/glutamyl-tRNA(Gln) amidotransferase subunit B
VDGKPKRMRLTRIHLEEDVAKNMHFEGSSGIDFNRGGTPLMEIVTEPDLTSADETMAFLLALKQVLQYGEVSDCNLEQGNIRCDVNSSVRRAGEARLGVKVELKNMNTFKGVHRALKHELPRQVKELERGRPVVQETRRWDDAGGGDGGDAHQGIRARLPLLPGAGPAAGAAGGGAGGAWRSELPELPQVRRARFVEQYGIPEYDAGVLVADKFVADYYEETVRQVRAGQGGLQLDHDRRAAHPVGAGPGRAEGQGDAGGAGRADRAGGTEGAQHAARQGGVRPPCGGGR